RPRPRCRSLENDRAYRNEDSVQGNYHWHSAGVGTDRRRDRATAFHRFWESLLESQFESADRRAPAADFYLRHLALRRLASPGLGWRAGAGHRNLLRLCDGENPDPRANSIGRLAFFSEWLIYLWQIRTQPS